MFIIYSFHLIYFISVCSCSLVLFFEALPVTLFGKVYAQLCISSILSINLIIITDIINYLQIFTPKKSAFLCVLLEHICS